MSGNMAPYAHRMMAQLDARGLTPAEITRELNALGLVMTQGNAWSEPIVAQAIRLMRKRETDKGRAAPG